MIVSFNSFQKAALLAFFSLATSVSNVHLMAADPIPLEPVPAALTTVPQNLLKLIHAPEVQKELDLEGDSLNSF